MRRLLPLLSLVVFTAACNRSFDLPDPDPDPTPTTMSIVDLTVTPANARLDDVVEIAFKTTLPPEETPKVQAGPQLALFGSESEDHLSWTFTHSVVETRDLLVPIQVEVRGPDGTVRAEVSLSVDNTSPELSSLTPDKALLGKGGTSVLEVLPNEALRPAGGLTATAFDASTGTTFATYTCTPATGLAWSCTATFTGTEPEDKVDVQVVMTDLAGNTTTDEKWWVFAFDYACQQNEDRVAWYLRPGRAPSFEATQGAFEDGSTVALYESVGTATPVATFTASDTGAVEVTEVSGATASAIFVQATDVAGNTCATFTATTLRRLDFSGKVAGSTSENPSVLSRAVLSDGLPAPTAFVGLEVTQSDYDAAAVAGDSQLAQVAGTPLTAGTAYVWAENTTLTVAPSARSRTSMVYDPVRDELLLFGGLDPSGNPLGDTWRFTGGTWVEVTSGTMPPARWAHAMAWDAVRQEIVLFGGAPGTVNNPLSGGVPLSDTWVWNGSAWSQKSPTTLPPARWEHMMAMDPVTETVMLNAGHKDTDYLSAGYLSDTWGWDGANWTEIVAKYTPSKVSETQLVSQPAFDTVFRHSGCDGQCRTYAYVTTYTWTGDYWYAAVDDNGPYSRVLTTAAYDHVGGEVVLFGGWQPTNYGTEGYASTTWTWAGLAARWGKAAPASVPPGREGASLAHLPNQDTFVLFGGNDDTTTYGDTWTLTRERRYPALLARFDASGLGLSAVTSVTVDAFATGSGEVGGILTPGTAVFVWDHVAIRWRLALEHTELAPPTETGRVARHTFTGTDAANLVSGGIVYVLVRTSHSAGETDGGVVSLDGLALSLE